MYMCSNYGDQVVVNYSKGDKFDNIVEALQLNMDFWGQF